MWCRKRIDIAWSDLLSGLWGALFRRDRNFHQQAIEQVWPANDRAVLSCLSVRSGWDLILSELDLPQGSEVLMSAMTIPDMAGIVRAHGLVPIPLEIETSTAAPSVETLNRAITENSRMVLIAHLFGSRVDLNPLIKTARDAGLMFLEDCAQAYVGPDFTGHAQADISMFSFGTIKNSTALGGGVFHMRDHELCEKLKSRQTAYPVQSRGKYLKRILKYSGLKWLSTYPLFSLFTACCRLFRINQNDLLNRSVRGFSGLDKEDLTRFRLQPSAALLGLLNRRLKNDRPKLRQRQRALGDRLRGQLQPFDCCPATDTTHHHYWVFPVLTDQPRELIELLRQAGFDATQGESLHIIPRPENSTVPEAINAQDMLTRMVYVPMYPELSDRALNRLGEVLVEFFQKTPPISCEDPALAIFQETQDA